MRIPRPDRVGAGVLLAALATRLAGVTVTSLTPLNPYAKVDAERFAASATETAATIASGGIPFVPRDPNKIVQLWGLLLSPIWLVPGPNRLYGRLFIAFLSAVAVYTLYHVGAVLHSRRAGVLAAAPLVCYPSYIFIHSTVLREGFVLAGLVGTTYLLVAEPDWLGHDGVRYTLAVLVLTLISVVRWENTPLYALVLATGLVVQYRDAIPKQRFTVGIVTVSALVAGWIVRPTLRAGLGWLMVKRRRRIGGRTVYLPGYVPETLLEAAVFAPVGAFFFMFTPFPWMVETAADAVVFGEAVVNLVAFGLALLGVPVVWRRFEPATAGLAVGVVAAALLYGLVNANVGTNVRQRQMFLWVLFVFAAIALAECWERRERLKRNDGR